MRIYKLSRTLQEATNRSYEMFMSRIHGCHICIQYIVTPKNIIYRLCIYISYIEMICFAKLVVFRRIRMYPFITMDKIDVKYKTYIQFSIMLML